MRAISSALFATILLLLTVCVFSTPSFADGQSVSGCSGCNGYSFQSTLTPVSGSPGQYTLTYKVTNNTGSASNPYNWSLTMFQSGNAISNPTNFSVTGSDGGNYTSAYQPLAGKSNNGNSNCNGNLSDAICVEQSGNGTVPTLNQGQSLTFTFNFTCNNCTELPNWDFLASGNCVANPNANCYAISSNGAPMPVPEPSVAALYGATLAAGLAFVWRSRRRAAKHPTRLPSV